MIAGQPDIAAAVISPRSKGEATTHPSQSACRRPSFQRPRAPPDTAFVVRLRENATARIHLRFGGSSIGMGSTP